MNHSEENFFNEKPLTNEENSDQTLSNEPLTTTYLETEPTLTNETTPIKENKKKTSKFNNAYTRTVLGGALAIGIVGGYAGSFLHDNGVNLNLTPHTVVQQNVSQNVTGNINWKATAATAVKSVVTIQTTGKTAAGEGSGVVYDDKGHVITNNHVVSMGGDEKYRVIIGNVSYQASLVGRDASTDLAVLKINNLNGAKLSPMSFGNSDEAVVGQEVMAIGSPLGLDDTVTTGIISALDRPVVTENASSVKDNDYVVTNSIQTTAAINPGNSGGALVNVNGELLGIPSSIATTPTKDNLPATSTSGNIGIGFAIPSTEVKRISDEILASGSVQHAYLGVTVNNNVIINSNTPGVSVLGVQITQLGTNTPAQKAGLQKGDNIIAVNGQNVTNNQSLVALVRASSPGDVLKMQVITATGQGKTVNVTLAKQPADMS